MSGTSPQQSNSQPAKPGTACLGCRRRKLKCTREQEGCVNCTKADLPCVYPAPETGVKRKRGPYKKDKPPRERHLEDLVKYLEPKAAHCGPANRGEPINNAAQSPSDLSVATYDDAGRKPSHSEDLVKDALNALTKSSAECTETSAEKRYVLPQTILHTSLPAGTLGTHPPIRQIFEYWLLYQQRVDPLLKIIHTPTFGKTLLTIVDRLPSIGPVTESLLFAIYYAAVGSCTNRECLRRFSEPRDILLQRYGRVIESALADNYSMPELESLQALVTYVICLRREDSMSNIRALFSLCVRMAQLIGLIEDPADAFPPFEAEYRRRLWWHICGLENRGAEEGGARQTSIMEGRSVRLPANLNDYDLYPEMTVEPKPRSGVTDMTFVLARHESVRTIYEFFKIKKRCEGSNQVASDHAIQAEQRHAFDAHNLRCQTNYMRHLDDSRPLDWICSQWIRLLAIKLRLIVDFPSGQVPTKAMAPQARHDLLRSSVEIIRISHSIGTEKGVENWLWYFRGWVQWHALAVVIGELGGNKNTIFVNTAWVVLDPILSDWDRVYRAKRDEPAWMHVNALIEKARRIRREMPLAPPEKDSPTGTPSRSIDNNEQVSQQGYQGFHAAQVTQSTVMGLMPTEYWQSGADSSDSAGASIPQYHPGAEPASTQQQFQMLGTPDTASSDVPLQTGCAPTMTGLDAADFGHIEGLDNIDFSAFDAVFMDMVWDFSSQSTDVNLEQLHSQADS